MSTPSDPRPARNLRRWLQSGQPRQWVESRCGAWEHHDWLILLANLRHSEFWPLDPDAVGAVLERIKAERLNLRRWQESEQGRRWVEACQATWDHGDWLRLLDELRDSAFWPLDPEAVGRLLEVYRLEWHNLRRWEQSGQPRRWIAMQAGTGGDADWRELLEVLRRSVYWPLDEGAVRELLGKLHNTSRRLRRWQESGWPRAWVAARRGRWGHPDWLSLLRDLERSDFWPLEPEAVGQVLEGFKEEHAPQESAFLPFPRTPGAARGVAGACA